MAQEILVKQIEDYPQLRRIVRIGVGYIYNGSTRAEVEELGFDQPAYGKLHEAACHTMANAGRHGKWFFPRLSDANTWLRSEVGESPSNWTPCGFCHPVAPRSDLTPPTRGKWRAIDSAGEYADAREGGFIYNGTTSDGAAVPLFPGKLHRAACTTLDLSGYRRKTWFSDVHTAGSWLEANVGREGEGWSLCSICYPADDDNESAELMQLVEDLFGATGIDELTGHPIEQEKAVSSSALSNAVAVQSIPLGEGDGDALAELQTTIEALQVQLKDLRRDRDALAATVASVSSGDDSQSDQFEAAWESAVQENYELQATVARLRSELELVTHERDAAGRALTEAQSVVGGSGGEATSTVASELYHTLEVRTRLSQLSHLRVRRLNTPQGRR